MSGIPDTFGRDYRRALLALHPPVSALAVAWVLIDHAYTRQTLTVETGYRKLREETCLHGRSIDKAREWLKANGLLENVESTGLGAGARTEWTLGVTGAAMTALERTFPDAVMTALGRTFNDRSNDRRNDRPNDRPGADTYPGPTPKTEKQEPVEARARKTAGANDCPLSPGCIVGDDPYKPATHEQLLKHLMSIHGLFVADAEHLLIEWDAA